MLKCSKKSCTGQAECAKTNPSRYLEVCSLLTGRGFAMNQINEQPMRDRLTERMGLPAKKADMQRRTVSTFAGFDGFPKNQSSPCRDHTY